jgi:hypothetical protein
MKPGLKGMTITVMVIIYAPEGMISILESGN